MSVLAPSSKPRLPRGVRLVHNEAQGGWVLLAPERVFKADQIAAEVLKRCTGEATLDEIVATSDKQVLMGGERLHIAEGVDHSPVVDTPFGRVGMYSCMDGVIFETPRMLAVRGAQLLLNSLNSFALDEAALHVPVRAS